MELVDADLDGKLGLRCRRAECFSVFLSLYLYRTCDSQTH